VILGDFDYVNSPSRWSAMWQDVLGPDYPILAVGGNHDVPAWAGYRDVIVRNMAASGLDNFCEGTLGVDMVCNYKGILFVLNQVGTQGRIADYVANAEAVLEANKGAPWKICGWHKNQRLYQTGDKSDETGYPILDVCRRYGAIVSTAHEHSYSRSVLMDDFASQSIVQPIQIDPLQLEFGRSFLYVSGLGGHSIRPWLYDAQENPWWAQCAATDNGVNYGALLCEFTDTEAVCEFVDLDGIVWDKFTVYPVADLTAPVPPANPCTTQLVEFGAAEDVHEDIYGTVYTSESNFSLTENSLTAAFRFTEIPISSIDDIRSAHLQLFGFSVDAGFSQVTIRAEITSDSSEFGMNVPVSGVTTRATTKQAVTWTQVDGEYEWEAGEVWVSPDLRPILNEVFRLDEWESGNSLTIIVQGEGSARRVFTRDQGDCVAPTLSLTLESPC